VPLPSRLLHDTEFTFMAHEFTAHLRGATKRFHRRITEEFHKMADIAGILTHGGQGEAIVAADHNLDATLADLFVGSAGRLEFSRQTHAFDDLLRHAGPFALEHRVVDEAKGWTDDNSLLGGFEHIERFLVGEVAVIDAVDNVPTKIHALADALGNPCALMLTSGKTITSLALNFCSKNTNPGAVIADKAYDADGGSYRELISSNSTPACP
jgi:hypothetical protein